MVAHVEAKVMHLTGGLLMQIVTNTPCGSFYAMLCTYRPLNHVVGPNIYASVLLRDMYDRASFNHLLRRNSEDSLVRSFALFVIGEGILMSISAHCFLQW
jgi:hypothetical protein